MPTSWPQTDIFENPRPIPGFYLDQSLVPRPDVAKQCPYYHLVPKTLKENIAFRREMIRLGCSKKSAGEDLWVMCSRDILFYVNTFCFTYDPRKILLNQNPIIPWITWKFQDTALLAINDAIGVVDLEISKSRDMGATWKFLLPFHYQWKFRSMRSFLIVSRGEDLVDAPEDSDTLFWKLDFLDAPRNMAPFLAVNEANGKANRTSMHLYNRETRSTIDGASTTGNVGRGGRRTAVGLDEFSSFPRGSDVEAMAATNAVTNCRIYNGTPKGTGTAHYQVAINPNIRHIYLHWSMNPNYAEGMTIDSYGNPTSPRIETERARLGMDFLYRQEYELDYLASSYPFFEAATIDRILRDVCVPPVERGIFVFQSDSAKPIRFEAQPNGELRLWRPLDHDGLPQRDREYVVGADISTGQGGAYGSNSVASVADRMTREKVAEFVTNDMSPEMFASAVVALCRFFCGASEAGAFLIWEDNGPGGSFAKEVIKIGYSNIFMRRNEKDLRKNISSTPGWWSNRDNKVLLMSEYRRALSRGEYKNYSREAVLEARNYQYANGSVEYVGTGATIDEGTMGQNHGDRVIADAVTWRGLVEMPAVYAAAAEDGSDGPVGSFAWRRAERRRIREEASKKWY